MSRFVKGILLSVVVALGVLGAARADCVVVLRLAVVPVGMSDEVLPSAREVGQLDRDVRAAVSAERGRVDVVAQSCEDAACAVAAARKAGCGSAVYGTVTRYMALLWALGLGSVDVRNGASRTSNQLYKGDFLALEHAIGPMTQRLVGKR
jgi:hypothetical protein